MQDLVCVISYCFTIFCINGHLFSASPSSWTSSLHVGTDTNRPTARVVAESQALFFEGVHGIKHKAWMSEAPLSSE